jgi:hypothetical protein
VPPEWKDTPAAEEHKRLQDRAEALLRGAETVRDWYARAAAEARGLWSAAGLWSSEAEKGTWADKVRATIDPLRRAPFDEKTPLSEPLKLTYGRVLRYERVVAEKMGWEREQKRLGQLLDVLSALRIILPSKGRPALLEILPDFTLVDAAEREKQLRQYYPDFQSAFALAALPDAVRPRVTDAANTQYASLLTVGRAEVLRQLGGKESNEGWERVRKWLEAPAELKSWRVLARVLRNFRPKPPADDPVTELARFLSADRFTVEPRALVLTIPDRAEIEPNANEPLTITRTRNGQDSTFRYKLADKAKADKQGTAYRYEPATADDRAFEYVPGDRIQIQVPLSGGKERLSWATSRTSRYSIERLWNPPRAEEVENKQKWRPVKGVTLRPEPEDSVPQVPDLVPTVPVG